MSDYVSLRLKDYDNENSGTKFNVVETTAANLDAQVAALGALRTALEGIMRQGWFSADLTDEVYSAAPNVTDPDSQRETKWVFIVSDSLGNVYKANEIPCADLRILENNSKYIYKNGSVTVTTAAAAVQAVVDAFNGFARDKYGNTITLRDIYQAGRNI